MTDGEIPNEEFRQWARKNYHPGGKINGLWHPIVRAECKLMDAEFEREKRRYPMRRKLYQEISGLLIARENCEKEHHENPEWHAKHTEKLLKLVEDHMPSGSGVDNGTEIDLEASRPDRLVFHTSYHHMNDSGIYDGWTEHQVIVTPSLHTEIDLRITGRDRNDIKEYLDQVFREALLQEVEITCDA